jgi:superfamily I DNA and/or RNA helicase
MVFVHVPGPEVKLDGGIWNPTEVDTVKAIIAEVMREKVSRMKLNSTFVGVLSFYRGQVDRLNDALRIGDGYDVRAQTVDSFQGNEESSSWYRQCGRRCEEALGFLRIFVV